MSKRLCTSDRTLLSARSRTAAALTAVALVALVCTACGKGDPEENFRLWSNNDAGWAEMAAYVADTGNTVEMRTLALKTLIESGHPSQVGRTIDKAPDKEALLLSLRAAMAEMLKNPNIKVQGYARQVLFESLELFATDAEKDKTREMIAQWAFGDLSPDDTANSIKEKLAKRIRPEEIEALGAYGVKGAEIMLSKAIARPEVMSFLASIDTPEAKVALINGLRRYHKIKNVKVTEVELGYIQRTKSPEGLVYFFELYDRLKSSEHPNDQDAARNAIAAAMDWYSRENDEGKKIVKEHYAAFKPLAEKFLTENNADDRWWAAQVLTRNEGLDGLKKVLSTLKDDTNYGNDALAESDVKYQMTLYCMEDVGAVGAEKAVPVLIASMENSARIIEKILAMRCLIGFGDQAAIDALTAFVKKMRKERELAVIDPIVVPQSAENVTLPDLAEAGLDIIAFRADVDKRVAEGKADAELAKLLKEYANFSFERKGKKLIAYAEARAQETLESRKAKAKAKAAE